MRFNLWVRLSLFFVLFSLLLSALFWVLQTTLLPQYITRQTFQAMRAEHTEVVDLIERDVANIAQRLAERENRSGLFITVYDLSGQVLYSTTTSQALRGLDLSIVVQEGFLERLVIVQTIPTLQRLALSDSVIVRMQTPLPRVDVAGVNTLFFFALLSALGIAFIFAWPLAQSLSNPLKELTRAVQTLSKMEFKEPLNVKGNDEIATLARTFNELQAKLSITVNEWLHELETSKTLQHAQQRFMAQASHELKTPLAIIEASLETLEDPTLSESERQALRASLHEEAQRMNALINRLLESVRAQVKDVALQWTQVEVRALTEKIAHDLGLKMHLTGPPAVPLLSDASLMHSLVSNLLRNAKDHRLKETEVRVTISDDPVFSWRCENLTPPLTLDPASLLRPFVKGNTASQGHGLGLSIVQDLAVRLGLKLELTVQNQHFSVTLTQPHKNR